MARRRTSLMNVQIDSDQVGAVNTFVEPYVVYALSFTASNIYTTLEVLEEHNEQMKKMWKMTQILSYYLQNS